MSMNDTPVANRLHISIFGKRNAGKSSLINALTGQQTAIVSEVAGTTTDPVYKTMEMLPLGPVVIYDTAGIDDEGELGTLRVEKSLAVLNKTDIAVYVYTDAIDAYDLAAIDRIKERTLPLVIVRNKCDIFGNSVNEDEVSVSAQTGQGIDELKKRLCACLPQLSPKQPLISDLIESGDNVVLVIPIDSAAPKGRIILPQQQVLREAIENGAIVTCATEKSLPQALQSLSQPPKLVVTDSQAFETVAKIVPEDVYLTSFSILMARFKGILTSAVHGARTLDTLKDGDTVLISEGCTHHRQCDDIGTVKLPRWIQGYTGKKLQFEFTSGGEFPKLLGGYKLIVHCGGCMLNEREVKYRYGAAQGQSVPITNYGILIAYVNGILERSIKCLDIK